MLTARVVHFADVRYAYIVQKCNFRFRYQPILVFCVTVTIIHFQFKTIFRSRNPGFALSGFHYQRKKKQYRFLPIILRLSVGQYYIVVLCYCSNSRLRHVTWVLRFAIVLVNNPKKSLTLTWRLDRRVSFLNNFKTGHYLEGISRDLLCSPDHNLFHLITPWLLKYVSDQIQLYIWRANPFIADSTAVSSKVHA